ncbi:MAG: hypothetical protein DSM106950_15575 [Stigonema ocellatum SAG 48.90 = DSM 106950]|nr:hypothetical protein [Stigonema ocellatum SAG 48.90 = DSM 106950]
MRSSSAHRRPGGKHGSQAIALKLQVIDRLLRRPKFSLFTVLTCAVYLATAIAF